MIRRSIRFISIWRRDWVEVEVEVEVEMHMYTNFHHNFSSKIMLGVTLQIPIKSATKEARILPITTLVEFLRKLMQKWFHDQRKAANKGSSILTDFVLEHGKNNEDNSQLYVLQPIDYTKYVVKDNVGIVWTIDLELRTCTCRIQGFQKNDYAVITSQLNDFKQKMYLRYTQYLILPVGSFQNMLVLALYIHLKVEDNRAD
ncbi:hypothetical protein Ddye_020990 [Dipteronia dyeriana]|uniref:Uncharacterized protein n=1 Tax=Dipteronia dyeriana TaxID=168575 RepID=A0AAD9WXK0_9ROSI|nr:hypothetical protein Ddye_020990 [Dipteronia dyeriana]